ncbi:MAG: hypothetical protein WBK91_09835 [Alphaproteobacteria bacterium]
MTTTDKKITLPTLSYDGLRAAYKFARLLDAPADKTLTEFFAIAEKKWQQHPALLKGLEEVDRLLTACPPAGDYPHGARLILINTTNRTIASARTFVGHFDKAARAVTVPGAKLPQGETALEIMRTALTITPDNAKERLGSIFLPAQSVATLPPAAQQNIQLQALRQTRKIAGTQTLEF